MKTFLQLLVVVVIGYAFWVYGLPWVERTVGRSQVPVSSPARGAGGACVQSAARASESLHDDLMEEERALLEDAQWNSIVASVDYALSTARAECGCKPESCRLAGGALSELIAVFETARASTRTSQSIPIDLSRRYEKANQTLWEAYDLA